MDSLVRWLTWTVLSDVLKGQSCQMAYSDNKLDLFFGLVPKGIWSTQGLLPVTEIVNHMFIIFVFSLYNMPIFTPPYL